MRSSSLVRTTAVALVVGIVLLAFFLGSLPSGSGTRDRSVFSADEEGRMAGYILLRELGFRPLAWREAPGHLPRGDHLLWLPGVPEPPPEYLRQLWKEMDAPPDEAAGDDAPTRPPVTRRLRDPRHYLRFVEEGGTLVVGLDDERREFLTEELELPEIEGLTSFFELYEEDEDVQVAVTRTGESIECDWGGQRWLGPHELGSPFEMLIADADGRPLALSLAVGRGAVAIVPSDRFFDNDKIDAADNALFLVRLVEELRPSGDLLLDEYALGGWVPESPLELAFAPSNFSFSIHLLLLCGLLIWTAAWVRHFPRDPEPIAQIAPLSRATSYGAMLAAWRRWDLLAAMLRRGVLRRLPNARRTAHDAQADGAELRRAVRSAVEPLADRASGPEEIEAWERALLPRTVDGRGGLDELAATLSHVERLARTGQKDHNGAARGMDEHGR